MRTRYRHTAPWFLACCLVPLLPALASAEWIDLGGDQPVTVELLSDAPGRTVYAIEIGGFEAEPVTIQDDTYYQIWLGGESRSQLTGFPHLPDVRRALMIADDRAVSVTILDSEHVDLPDMPVAPSKGNLTRDVDPAMVPYRFDAFYQSNGVWPAQVVETEEPHIVRDARGVVVEANVFQYFPGTTTLRVTTRLVVEVADNGPGQVNVLRRDRAFDTVDPQFRDLYRDHFLNSLQTRYNPVVEQGGLLIITDDAFAGTMQPLVEWKQQKGLDTRLVTTSLMGSSFTQIKNYISAQYSDWAPAYVLLVGDIAQIPIGSDSDPEYSTLAGSDSYPELFVGRFSAGSAAECATQVERTITYERDVDSDRWMQRGVGIASDEGPGDDGEWDIEHEDVIRGKLLDYGYALVDQIYDPGASASTVTTSLNAGRGIINYTGHGSSTSWGSTGFSNTNVNALTNDNMLPFICSVACNNGTFTSTCFAEAWLRATNAGVPTGAIATYMSYISQSWDPPMCGQDHVVDLLVDDQMRTIGGLFFNGSCQMMDEYGSTGANEFLNWTIFGDPSLMVRTKEPTALTVLADPILLIGMNEMTVQTYTIGARCALYADGVLYGTAVTDGGGFAQIIMNEPPTEPMELTLTTTAYNMITDVRTVQVLPPDGPYLVLESTSIVDAAGDGDESLDNGELVDLSVMLENVGVETATGLSAVLASADPYIDIVANVASYADIAVGGMGLPTLPFEVQVAGTPPNGHLAQLTMQVSGDGGVWDVVFNLPIEAPALAANGCVVSDETGGDGSGTADAGETVQLQVTLANSGGSDAHNLSGVLSCSHPEVNILGSSGSATMVAEGGQALLGTFEVQILGTFPEPALLALDLSVTDLLGYVTELPLELAVGGWFDDMEGDRGWTAGAAGDNASSGLWTRAVPVGTDYNGAPVQTGIDHTPGLGTMCWVTGNGAPGGTAGANDVDGGITTLLSPVFDLDGAVSATVSYWRWYTNDAGNNPGEDWWTVSVTDDGINWVQLEYTQDSNAAWQQFTFDLSAYVGFTDAVQLRFVASDAGAGSLVEAAVDDFLLDAAYGIALGVDEDTVLPRALVLAGNHPNPFNPATTISFAVPRTGEVQLAVYDIAGRRVATLVDGVVTAGHHEVTWQGRNDRGQNVASGVYFCRLVDGESLQTRKMLLVK